jgi:hypothetical protein
MTYYLNLFSPDTYETFARSDRSVSGFTIRHLNTASRIKPGDRFICYLTKLSRWFAVLEVVRGPFQDKTPLYYPVADPFIVRFSVNPIAWLPFDKAVPIFEESVWQRLSFTRGLDRSSPWTAKLRRNLRELDQEDGRFLDSLLREQSNGGTPYPLDETDLRKLATHRVRRIDRDITVSVPEATDEEEVEPEKPAEVRESVRIQAILADIGDKIGMDIWVPRSDRSAVLAEWKGDHRPPLDRLPLNYDDTTLKTVEQIDVLWLKGRSIRRAFEVEHTTSVYSGILRMADLLALQPNMDIKLHIVAPFARRDKVKRELQRPVFSLLERGPLSDSCTYLSYDSVKELIEMDSLSHMKESVLDDYEEGVED